VHSQDSGIIVSGWWPNGRGLLCWLDPSHSGSIAADGMALLSMPLASRQPRLLTWTLSYPDYLAWSPAAQRLLLVAGRGRAVYGHKTLALCNVPRDTCRPLLRRQDVVSLDPAWAPDGRHIAFVTAYNLGDVGGFSSDQGLLSWIRSRHLWVADSRGAGAHVLHVAGAGTFTPQWSRDGTHLLYVRDNALWLVPVHGGAAVQVARLFATPGLPPYQSPLGGPFWRLFYYGHVAWTSLFAWYRG
jgi:TolB protein